MRLKGTLLCKHVCDHFISDLTGQFLKLMLVRNILTVWVSYERWEIRVNIRFLNSRGTRKGQHN